MRVMEVFDSLRGGRTLLASIATMALAVLLPAEALAANTWPAACPGYSQCPVIDLQHVMRSNPGVLKLNTAIADLENASLAAGLNPALPPAQQKIMLGAAIMFDVNLSPLHNQACASCHSPAAGYAGGVPYLNQTTVIFPGTVTTRTAFRKPPSAAYAAFAPVLHYDSTQQNFIGGTFLDQRGTGLVTGIPVADQAMGPLTGAAEMALADPACAAYRISDGKYAGLFGQVWGANALAIHWPANTVSVCNHPNNSPVTQTPLQLSTADRQTASAAFTQIVLSIAAFEASPSVSPFSSKFDAYLAGQAQLSSSEMRGYRLVLGKAHCSQCHSATGSAPLFTNFAAENIGVPPNPDNPYYDENVADPSGYIGNPVGPAFVDNGVGSYLASAADTNPQWQALAPLFVGRFQVATLRNVAMAQTSRAYMHDGFFKTLKTIVHFYNTRDVLPACAGGAADQIGVTCWPAPEQAANLNTTQIGNLGLTDDEENAVVAFLQTLTDGYQTSQ